MNQRLLEINITKIALLNILRYAILTVPILTLFFKDKGLSQFEIIALQAIFGFAIFFFEVPSGYFSDRFGRKRALVLGTILGSAGWIIYPFLDSFETFVVAEILLALGASFISGSDSALLYDTLKELDREDEAAKLEGRLLAAGNFTQAFACVVGGLLAAGSLITPFYVSAILISLSIPVALSLTEPERKEEGIDGQTGAIEGLRDIVREVLTERPEVRRLLLYSGTISAGTLFAFWISQPWLELTGLKVSLFGVVYAAINATVGFWNLQAWRVEAFLGRKWTQLHLLGLLFILYLAMASSASVWIIPFLLLSSYIRGILNVTTRTMLNQWTSSDRRATVLSFQGLVMRGIFGVVGPFFGWQADLFGINTAIGFAGIFFLAAGLGTWWGFRLTNFEVPPKKATAI